MIRVGVEKLARFTSKTFVPGKGWLELIDVYETFKEYYPLCELQSKNWIVKNMRPDWNIIDVGANIGYYSIIASKIARRGMVAAYEPTSTFIKLNNNLDFHGCHNVLRFNVALGSKLGVFKEKIFQIWGENPVENDFTFSTIDSEIERLGWKRLDLIKIDCDSYDLEVVMGAKDVIEKYNPYILIELNHALEKRGYSVSDAFKYFSSIGFDRALRLDGENFLFKRTNKPLNSKLKSFDMNGINIIDDNYFYFDARIKSARRRIKAIYSDFSILLKRDIF